MHASRVWANQVISFFLHATPDEKRELINYLVDFLFIFFFFLFLVSKPIEMYKRMLLLYHFSKIKRHEANLNCPDFPIDQTPPRNAFYRFAITILRNSNLSHPETGI